MKKRIFSSKAERRSYVSRLIKASPMPKNEQQRWERLVPAMESAELDNLRDILERQMSELADVYLKILQRKNESRVADLETEYGPDALQMNMSSLGQYFEIAPKIDETQFEVVEDPSERAKEESILEYLVRYAPFISEESKTRMIETIQKLPMLVIQDLQAVVIREGLRALRRKQFVQDVIDQQATPS